MLEREMDIEQLVLPLAFKSTRLFGEGNFEGGYESFSRARSMFKMAQEEPEFLRINRDTVRLN